MIALQIKKRERNICTYLFDVLSLKGSDERVESFVISINTNRGKDFLYISGGRGGVTASGSKKVSCEVFPKIEEKKQRYGISELLY